MLGRADARVHIGEAAKLASRFEPQLYEVASRMLADVAYPGGDGAARSA